MKNYHLLCLGPGPGPDAAAAIQQQQRIAAQAAIHPAQQAQHASELLFLTLFSSFIITVLGCSWFCIGGCC